VDLPGRVMTVVHCKKEPFTHYIGRPSTLGNPYTHKKTNTLAEFIVPTIQDAINCFEAYARNNPDMLLIIKQLPESAILGCWCKPGPCHGDIIIKLWKELNETI
jgi:hypothetical protein